MKLSDLHYPLELEAERATKDDCQEGKPSHSQAHPSGKSEEWFLNERNPYGLDGTGDDRVGQIAEGDDQEEEPCPDWIRNWMSILDRPRGIDRWRGKKARTRPEWKADTHRFGQSS